MKTKLIILLVLFTACQHMQEKKTVTEPETNPLSGNWQFLDKYGNYNEVWFGDSIYHTVNRLLGSAYVVKYTIRNDSLHTETVYRGKKKVIRAGLGWIDPNHLVISTGNVSDTLLRMKDAAITLGNTDPARDSLAFYSAFYKRYEEFLVAKGILTEEEVRLFHDRGYIPEDVIKQ